MPLSAGDRLGPYEVIAPLGAGGMGVVYRARDTRLGRSVAIKVLPESVSRSAEHRQRFEREARAIAALNHPNICTLHDVGCSGDTDYLVMELVDGQTLAERLKRGPLPPADVTRIGAEVANALARAHRAGVLHRDLKPANVMLTKTGAKLMDFGLARLSALDGASPLSQVRTQTAPITGEGKIVGTFHYMAPEQLEGHEADVRSDIWSLGATLYEMATGRPAFDGESTASVISAILREEPRPLAELAPMSPPALDRLVRTCLAKDPDARWQSAADLARELRWAGEAPDGAMRAAPARTSRVALLVAAGTALATVVLAALALKLEAARRLEASRVVRTSITFPGTTASYITGSNIALAPDGSAVAATLPDTAGRWQLYVRRLDAFSPQLLETPGEATIPLWSPDSREIAYTNGGGKVQRIPVTGGPPETVCQSGFACFIGAWGMHGDLLLCGGPRHDSIYRVAATGGTPVLVADPDTARGELGFRGPAFFPDGLHFLFAVHSLRTLPRFNIRVGSLAGGKPHDLLIADSSPRIAPDGTLLYLRDRVLMAQRASPDGSHLIGPAQVLQDEPERKTGWSLTEPGACATSNLLAYSPRDRRATRLQWFSRTGVPLAEVADVDGALQYPVLAPDESRAILHYTNGVETNLWLLDFKSRDPVQITPSSSIGRFPIWFPDSRRIVFNFMGSRGSGMALQAVDDPASFRQVISGDWTTPSNMLGATGPVLFSRTDQGTQDVWVAFPDSGWKSVPYAASDGYEDNAQFLAGGSFVLFEADYNGRIQIFADTFPTRGHLVALTTEKMTPGTLHVRGSEVLYLAGDNRTVRSLMVTAASGGLRVGAPRTLFTLPPELRGLAVSRDGQRFLVASPVGAPATPSVTLVHNWRAALRDHR